MSMVAGEDNFAFSYVNIKVSVRLNIVLLD